MKPETNQRRAQTVGFAMLFEVGLGFVGVVVAALAGIDLKSQLVVSQDSVIRGLLAVLPMLAMLVVLYRVPWGPLTELRDEVERVVGELFGGSSWLELALVSIAAGVGEEVLFRGALQPLAMRLCEGMLSEEAAQLEFARTMATWVGIVAVAILFGLAHAMTKTYFILAMVIGIYFGWLAVRDNNLVAPIVAHAVYDFIALAIIQIRVGKRGTLPPAT